MSPATRAALHIGEHDCAGRGHVGYGYTPRSRRNNISGWPLYVTRIFRVARSSLDFSAPVRIVGDEPNIIVELHERENPLFTCQHRTGSFPAEWCHLSYQIFLSALGASWKESQEGPHDS